MYISEEKYSHVAKVMMCKRCDHRPRMCHEGSGGNLTAVTPCKANLLATRGLYTPPYILLNSTQNLRTPCGDEPRSQLQVKATNLCISAQEHTTEHIPID